MENLYNNSIADQKIDIELSPSSDKKKTRHRIKGDALQILEAAFSLNSRPSLSDISHLARCTGEQAQRIRIWFNNRRGKSIRQRVNDEYADGNLLESSIKLDNGRILDLLEYKPPDEVAEKLRDKVICLQRRLQILLAEQEISRDRADTSIRLPPIKNILGMEYSFVNDLKELQRTLHCLLEKIVARNDLQASPRDIGITLRDANGEGVERALNCLGPAFCTKLDTDKGKQYILRGNCVLLILRGVDNRTNSKECIVMTNYGVRIKIEGVCVSFNEGNGIIVQAACTPLGKGK